jgi:hypothetical protein
MSDLSHAKKIHANFIEGEIKKYGRGKKRPFKIKLIKSNNQSKQNEKAKTI